MKASKLIHIKTKLESKKGTATLIILLIAVSMIKIMPFVGGRFWAEEGAIFYSSISSQHGLSGLLFLFNGHIEFVTNLVIYIASLVELKYAPLVTTYLSLLFQSIPILFLIIYRREINLPFYAACIFVIILAGLPQSAEVWANAINLHFHFALLAALILATPVTESRSKYTHRFLLLLSGASGIPANFLFPLFILSSLIEKQRERMIQAIVIFATAALQISLLAFNSHSLDSRINGNPLIIWLAMVAQQVVSPTSSFYVADNLTALLQKGTNGDYGVLFFSLTYSLPILFFFKSAIALRSREVIIFATSMLLLSICSVITSLGDKAILISSASGGRYFFSPNALMVLVLLISADKNKTHYIRIYLAILLLASIPRLHHSMTGKSWEEAYRTAHETNSTTIEIWPHGWFMAIPQTH